MSGDSLNVARQLLRLARLGDSSIQLSQRAWSASSGRSPFGRTVVYETSIDVRSMHPLTHDPLTPDALVDELLALARELCGLGRHTPDCEVWERLMLLAAQRADP